jgi:hypothetical protein
METDPVFLTLQQVQQLSNPDCNTPSSEHFRIDLHKIMQVYDPDRSSPYYR